MDQKQIQDVVRQVLTEVLAKPRGYGDGPARRARIETGHPVPRRKLAEENLARWLGHEPSRRAGHEPLRPARLESFADKPSATQSPAGEITCEDKNLIPHARKPEKLNSLLCTTPARIGVWRTGTRYLTQVALKIRADHAVAKDAVYAELKPGFAEANGWIPLSTKAKDKEQFLLRPDLGRQLDDASLKIVQEKAVKNPDVQITVADGLSAWAAERYAKPLIDELQKLLKENGLSVGTIFCVKYSRIAIQDVIGEAAGAKFSMILLGERPGLGSGDSLSNYMIYGPKIGAVNANKSMISNIHPLGHKPADAAHLTMSMIKKMFEQKCSGIELRV
jgi:ethanolamine ammonia-lyase small subunit